MSKKTDKQTVWEGLEWLGRSWSVTYRPVPVEAPPPSIWLEEDDLLNTVHETLQAVAKQNREARKLTFKNAPQQQFEENVIDLEMYESLMEDST